MTTDAQAEKLAHAITKAAADMESALSFLGASIDALKKTPLRVELDATELEKAITAAIDKSRFTRSLASIAKSMRMRRQPPPQDSASFVLPTVNQFRESPYEATP
jgi:hypothetical protein